MPKEYIRVYVHSHVSNVNVCSYLGCDTYVEYIAYKLHNIQNITCMLRLAWNWYYYWAGSCTRSTSLGVESLQEADKREVCYAKKRRRSSKTHTSKLRLSLQLLEYRLRYTSTSC